MYDRSIQKWVKPILIGLLAAVILWIGVTAVFSQLYKSESERTGLYWNGYAKLFVEQTGGFAGLQEKMQRNRYMMSGDRFLIVFIYDTANSKAAAIAYNNFQSDIHVYTIHKQQDKLRKMPILVNGEVIGYSAIHMGKSVSYQLAERWLPIVGGLFMMWGSMLVRRRRLKLIQQERLYTASLLYQQIMEQPVEKQLGAEEAVHATIEVIRLQKERLNKLETVRRTMVADIAHELKTPIAVMRTQLEHAILDNQSLSLDQAAALHDETIRLTKLVRDLQQLSLAESGNLSLAKSWFSLAELARQVVETLAIEAEEQQIHTTLHAPHELLIYADESRLRQVIINLLGNALEHAKTDVQLTLGMNESKTMIRLEVRDDGNGMEEEDLTKVFDRFFRGAKRGGAVQGKSGLGLGLAIVKEFVHAHQGNVEAWSKFGKGTCFSVEIPVMQE